MAQSLPNGRHPHSPPTSPKTRNKNSHGNTGPSAQADGCCNSRRRLVNYEALLHLFECPACHDWVSPPIAQCRKGHVICGPCRNAGLKACPCCKQRFSQVPNLMMEQMTNVMTFPCRFQSQGCSDFIPLSAKSNHEAFCSYRPVNCQFSPNGCQQVLPFHQMEIHVLKCAFRSSHPK